MGFLAERKQIVMNISAPPSADDVLSLAVQVIDNPPHDLVPFIENLSLHVQDFPDAVMVDTLDLESEYDLLALFRPEGETIPGIIKKSALQGPQLVLFRRPILDLWCDCGDDLAVLVRHITISEIAQANGFSDEEIEAMCAAAAHAA